MSYKIDYSKDKVIATFGEKIKESEITETFLKIIDTINIININAIIFDCSKTIDYTIPADYYVKGKSSYTIFNYLEF
jgi:hypothetical protein